MAKMEEKFQTSFRDVAELNQATQFLHENGKLASYNGCYDNAFASEYTSSPHRLLHLLVL